MDRSLAALAAFIALAACGRADRTADLTIAPPPHEPPAAASAPPAPPAPPPRGPQVTSDSLSDAVITGKVKAEILNDPGMAGADVSVNTDKGVVVLAGTVKSQEQTAIASAHAQRQDGVMRVDNHLAYVAR